MESQINTLIQLISGSYLPRINVAKYLDIITYIKTPQFIENHLAFFSSKIKKTSFCSFSKLLVLLYSVFSPRHLLILLMNKIKYRVFIIIITNIVQLVLFGLSNKCIIIIDSIDYSFQNIHIY